MKHNPYTQNLKVEVFDIETTGLNPSSDRVITAGFCGCDGSNLTQYFCESPANEDIILEQIAEHLSGLDAVVTYNGRMFDIPFVLSRARKNRVDCRIPLLWNIDIYRWLKNYWPVAHKLNSLTQKNVEYTLGLDQSRSDEIGGGECISLYSEYVNWNDSKAKDLILLHNADDVRQLARITEKLNFLPYHRIAFEKGFGTGELLIEESKITKNKLTVKAKAAPGLMAAEFYGDNYHMVYDPLDGSASLEIAFRSEENYLFADLSVLPVNMADFGGFPGISSGFIIGREGKEINYRTLNKLSSEMLRKIL